MSRVDAHLHFWHLARGDYHWLTPELAPLYRDFGPDDVSAALDAAAVDHVVVGAGGRHRSRDPLPVRAGPRRCAHCRHGGLGGFRRTRCRCTHRRTGGCRRWRPQGPTPDGAGHRRRALAGQSRPGCRLRCPAGARSGLRRLDTCRPCAGAAGAPEAPSGVARGGRSRRQTADCGRRIRRLGRRHGRTGPATRHPACRRARGSHLRRQRTYVYRLPRPAAPTHGSSSV